MRRRSSFGRSQNDDTLRGILKDAEGVISKGLGFCANLNQAKFRRSNIKRGLVQILNSIQSVHRLSPIGLMDESDRLDEDDQRILDRINELISGVREDILDAQDKIRLAENLLDEFSLKDKRAARTQRDLEEVLATIRRVQKNTDLRELTE